MLSRQMEVLETLFLPLLAPCLCSSLCGFHGNGPIGPVITVVFHTYLQSGKVKHVVCICVCVCAENLRERP